MDSFWYDIYFGNTVKDWAIALGIVIIAFTILRVIRKVVLIRLTKWAAKTETSIDNLIVSCIEHSVIPLMYILILYAAAYYLIDSAKLMHTITKIFWVVVMFFVLRIITASVRYFIVTALTKKDKNKIRVKQAQGLIVILIVCIWIFGFIFLLDNLGYNVVTLLAGLGIGGIAVALAAQNILGDLFSYFVIFFDRPFDIGDYVVVDSKSGTIEYIGLKTTRIRTPDGEQLVCSNKDLTDSRLHNYGRMEKRRVVFNIRIVYQINHDKLKQITTLVKEIIEKEPDVEFDRAHLAALGNSSLEFEIVYFNVTPDYNQFMDRRQAILLNIFDAFEKENIVFAYPTQTLFFRPHDEGTEKKLSPEAE